jgi:hypothetical protein
MAKKSADKPRARKQSKRDASAAAIKAWATRRALKAEAEAKAAKRVRKPRARKPKAEDTPAPVEATV